jgi:hypothetical protein
LISWPELDLDAILRVKGGHGGVQFDGYFRFVGRLEAEVQQHVVEEDFDLHQGEAGT